MVQLMEGRVERKGLAQRALEASPQRTVPVVILTGFLGAGKTTLLQHLLCNSEGLKIGVVVNDLAATNIDGMLLAAERADRKEEGQETDDGPVQLQNGCACCSLGDGLFSALGSLQKSAARRGKQWDFIVVECSGVARPQNLLAKCVAATGSPLMENMQLGSVVTVVDASVFMDMYNSRASAGETPGEKSPPENEALAATQSRIGDLLVEQLECADIVVLNKIELCQADQITNLQGLLATLAPGAVLRCTSFGKVGLKDTLEAKNEFSDAKARVDESTRAEATLRAARRASAVTTNRGHSAESACSEHGHHQQDHGDGGYCNDDGCTGHEHEPGHGHEHGHGHGHGPVVASHVSTLGVQSFVYSCTQRPFHPLRLARLLGTLPVVEVNIPSLWWLQDQFAPDTTKNAAGGTHAHPFQTVLRSKGFAWVAHDPGYMQYWSHAATQCSLTRHGAWPAGCTPSTEIALLGIGLDVAAAEGALNACLLTDVEMLRFRAAESMAKQKT